MMRKWYQRGAGDQKGTPKEYSKGGRGKQGRWGGYLKINHTRLFYYIFLKNPPNNDSMIKFLDEQGSEPLAMINVKVAIIHQCLDKDQLDISEFGNHCKTSMKLY
jgi:hypothetical protein